MISYFIAFDFPDPLQRQLASLCYALPSIQWVEENNFHLILRHLGPLNDFSLSSVEEALAHLSFFPFQARLKGVDYFQTKGGQGILWTGISPLEPILNLKKTIDRALKGLTVSPQERSYRPHVMLGHYDKLNPHRLGEYFLWNSSYQSDLIEMTEFHLFSCQTTPKHMIYEKIASYSALTPDVFED